MMSRLVFFLSFILSACVAGAQLKFSQPEIQLGEIPETSEIQGDVVLTNAGNARIYLLRADAGAGIRVYTSKKTLLPGDTALLVISFFPEKKGAFRHRIRLVASDRAAAYDFHISGNILNLKTDGKMACYYFGSRRKPDTGIREEPLVVQPAPTRKDNSNRIPDPQPAAGTQPAAPPPAQNKTAPETHAQRRPAKPQPPANAPLPEDTYRPNNILFLVDVSGSMKDSLKLPLMKTALHTLINAVRDIDTITFVTYADTIKVISEAISGDNKEALHQAVTGLKARGMTGGRKAILFSQALAQKHFIEGGNNQIIMASDGKFRFENEDYTRWKKLQGSKRILLSTVAFGNDREAIRNLRSISNRGEGSFIHIKSADGSQQALLDEIKQRSRIRNLR